MGDKTNITWTDKTWNPWYGCRKVSAGCKNCYMFRDMKHYGKDPNTVQKSKSTFNVPLKWKEPSKIFVCSWSDFFIEDADDWRAEAWDIIKRCPQHTFQLCTKRPERIAQCLPSDWGRELYKHVWLGATTEDQQMFDERIGKLLKVPAEVHWLSIEPMLSNILIDFGRPRFFGDYPPVPIDWVVVGGESGPGYRKMDLNWARSIRDQCQSAGVPFFFKQESGLHPGTNPKLDGIEYHEFPQQ